LNLDTWSIILTVIAAACIALYPVTTLLAVPGLAIGFIGIVVAFVSLLMHGQPGDGDAHGHR
jgi:hypothetical protein